MAITAHKPTVYVVDDDTALVETICDVIEAAHLGVHLVPLFSGKEALTKVSTHAPGVVISDVKMPEIDGLEMLRGLNARGIYLPVVFLSGYRNKEVIAEAWRLGAFDFLDKPFQPHRLIEIVQIALELGQEFSRSRERHVAPASQANVIELRINPDLHQHIKDQAAAENLSEEAWCLKQLIRSAS